MNNDIQNWTSGITNKVLIVLSISAAIITTSMLIHDNLNEVSKTALIELLIIISIILVIIILSLIPILRSNREQILYDIRDRPFVNKFINSQIKKLKNKGEIIRIETVSQQSNSFREAIETLINKKELPIINAEILILKSNSEGSTTRANFEVKDITHLNQKLESAKRDLKRLVHLAKSFNGSNISLREYKFAPSFYTLRINDIMIVSFYLREKGHLCPYLLLSQKKNPKVFQDFVNYFEQIRDESTLSDEIC